MKNTILNEKKATTEHFEGSDGIKKKKKPGFDLKVEEHYC
jgi:hypothetical protein